MLISQLLLPLRFSFGPLRAAGDAGVQPRAGMGGQPRPYWGSRARTHRGAAALRFERGRLQEIVTQTTTADLLAQMSASWP